MPVQPDQPRPFGYKTAWLAVRSAEPTQVAQTLRLHDARIASWNEGIEEAYRDAVFVSPRLVDWILAVGHPLWPPASPAAFITPLLERLSREFGEAQFFCTHRVVETHVWARAVAGRLLRGYGYTGERGETLWDEGGQSNEEKDLGFRFFDERSPESDIGDYWAREDLTFPDEGCVMRLAAAWSLDPTCLDTQFGATDMGLLGHMNVSKAVSKSNR